MANLAKLSNLVAKFKTLSNSLVVLHFHHFQHVDFALKYG